jgi:hypothetical protein
MPDAEGVPDGGTDSPGRGTIPSKQTMLVIQEML